MTDCNNPHLCQYMGGNGKGCVPFTHLISYEYKDIPRHFVMNGKTALAQVLRKL